MAEERPNNEVLKKIKDKKPPFETHGTIDQTNPFFSILPLDISHFLLQKFHPITLLVLRVDRFFYSTINNFILFFEKPRLTLLNLFRSRSEKSNSVKKSFRKSIMAKKEKLPMMGDNLDLLIQKTDLWNKIETFILRKQGLLSQPHITTYSQHPLMYSFFEKYFSIPSNFSEKSTILGILYHLAEFSLSIELKQSLTFHFDYNNRERPDMPPLLKSFFNKYLIKRRQVANHSNPIEVFIFKNKLSLWVSCPKEHEAEFTKWYEEIAKCFPSNDQGILRESDLANHCIFFAKELDQKGDFNQFTMVLDEAYAYGLFVTYPLAIASELIANLSWHLAGDLIETCELLLQETEKFRGFNSHLDKKIEDVQRGLENVKKLQPKYQIIKNWIQESGGYREVNFSKIPQEIFPGENTKKLFDALENKKLPYVYQAIENWIKQEGGYARISLATLRQNIDQENLSDESKTKLFETLKAKKISHITPIIEHWIELNGGYGSVNLVSLKQRIDQEQIFPEDKAELFSELETRKLPYVMDPINDVFGKHPNDKSQCLSIFKKQLTQPGLSVKTRTRLFDAFGDKEELNRHRNPNFDRIFGIRNTRSWRETWKEVRDDAKAKVFVEVEELTTNAEKKEFLDYVKKYDLFKKHRNNFFFEGAFGRTQAVIDIDKKHANLTKNVV